ncbi:OmpA family protein [candidate division KSB1 bacterium]|nr:OmpA family protein [candidate division KSB1 bacterium]
MNPIKIDHFNEINFEKIIDSLQYIIIKKDTIINFLKTEVRNKDLELIALTQEANRDMEELKRLKLPEFKPDEYVSADEYLNILYQRLNDNLNEEIKNNEVLLSWRDNNICITLAGKISFTTGSAYLKLRGESVLKKICDLLKQNPNKKIKIMVMGHTDAQPYRNVSEESFSNWELSALRATKVVRCLMRLGAFDGKNLYSVGNSAYHPIADNNTYQGRIENRRIELLISMAE